MFAVPGTVQLRKLAGEIELPEKTEEPAANKKNAKIKTKRPAGKKAGLFGLFKRS